VTLLDDALADTPAPGEVANRLARLENTLAEAVRFIFRTAPFSAALGASRTDANTRGRPWLAVRSKERRSPLLAQTWRTPT